MHHTCKVSEYTSFDARNRRLIPALRDVFSIKRGRNNNNNNNGKCFDKSTGPEVVFVVLSLPK